MPEFAGLPKDFFAFFKELKANNTKTWFEENKNRFRASVQIPLSDFITAMAPRLAKISRNFNADPRPHGGSMFRIYRDTRFSKDKTPYKENAGVHFRHALGKDAHAPGFYMHFAPGEVFYGGGLWMPEPPVLSKIRQAIADKPKAWGKIVEDVAFKDHFGHIQGESLARPPKGFDPSVQYIEDIKRKSFYAMREANEKAALSPDLPERVAESFIKLKPLMKFLCEAAGAPL